METVTVLSHDELGRSQECSGCRFGTTASDRQQVSVLPVKVSIIRRLLRNECRLETSTQVCCVVLKV